MTRLWLSVVTTALVCSLLALLGINGNWNTLDGEELKTVKGAAPVDVCYPACFAVAYECESYWCTAVGDSCGGQERLVTAEGCGSAIVNVPAKCDQYVPTEVVCAFRNPCYCSLGVPPPGGGPAPLLCDADTLSEQEVDHMISTDPDVCGYVDAS